MIVLLTRLSPPKGARWSRATIMWMPVSRRKPRKASVFLCHSSADREFVRRLAEDLANVGIRTWVDESELRVGDSLIERIGAAIENAAFVCVVLSKTSIESPWVRRELQLALTNEFAARPVMVLPILLERVSVPHFLQDKVYADFTDPNRYASAFTRLVESVRGRRAKQTAKPAAPNDVRSQTESDFGRDLAVMLKAAIVEKRVYFVPNVPAGVLRNAAAACNFRDYEGLLCVFDYANNWFFTGGSTAIIVTVSGVYFGRVWDG